MTTRIHCELWVGISIFIIVFGTVDARPMDYSFDSMFNRTSDVIFNIYDSVVNDTNDVINNISVHNYTEAFEKLTNCSIVLGGALAGAAIAPIAVGVGIPLILFVLGFTCFGIMAGSAAACCQSSIGDVPKGSCFACLQSTGAGGGKCIIITACIIGIPLGLGLGGYVAESYADCFGSIIF